MAQNDRTTGLVGNSGIKVTVQAASTAALVLSGEQTVDGVVLTTGERVLVKDQASSVANGIYVVDTGSWERAKDADGSYDWVQGSLLFVYGGTVNGNKLFKCTSADPIVVDTSAMTFEAMNLEFTGSSRDIWCGTATGTANAIILTPAAAVTLTMLTAGLALVFKSGAAPNSAATTINVSGTGVRAAQSNAVAMVGGEIEASKYYRVTLDATGVYQTERVAPAVVLSMFIKGTIVIGTGAGAVAAQLVGSDGQALTADASKTSGHVYIDNPSRPNKLINPNWQIDQINEGGLYTVNATDVRGPDGFSGDAVGAGVFKLRTLADPDNGALKCLEITCTTADASIGATDRYEVWTAVEGYGAAAFMLGTASAAPFTYQFKLKSNSVTGVFGVYFSNSAGNRFYAGTITVPDTAEHEYSVSITGDLAGTWLYTNGIGLRMGLVLAAGANFQGVAGAWGAGTVRTTAAQANFMSVNTNIIYLKRGQLIQGALVQAYQPADIEKELSKAQRYYEKTFNQGVVVQQNITSLTGALSSDFAYANAAGVISVWHFAVIKRSAPTIVTYNPTVGNANWRRSDNGADTNASIGTAAQAYSVLQGDSSTTAGFNYFIHASANARLS